jgi:dipeptidase E
LRAACQRQKALKAACKAIVGKGRMIAMKLFLTSLFSGVADLFPDIAPHEGKTVAFIPTAGNVEPDTYYIDDNKAAFAKLGMILHDLDVSKETTEHIKATIDSCDYIYVEGGNTFYLLQELKRSGADKIIIDAVKGGKLYIGTSAGSFICSKDIEFTKIMDPIELGPELNGDFTALGFVDFCVVPHYGWEPYAESAKLLIKLYSDTLSLRILTNEQAVVVDGDKEWIVTAEQ